MELAKVLGLGPSGSAFVATYRNAIGVDSSRRYFKACGEAVPVETPLVDRRYIVDTVRRYKFYSWRREVGEVAYSRARWHIVEKAQWIESMRRGGASGEGGWDILVKAGGPYQSVGEKIIVARAYVEGRRLEDETAYFVFPEAGVGFYWVFPHGGVLNVGGGFLGVSNPVPYVLKFVEEWLGGGRVVDVRGAPLTVRPTILLHDGEGFRIGEAAGLVYPLTGEGIRPGILSALALASALKTKRPLETYRRQLEGIIRQIEFQKRLLGLAQRLAGGGNLLELADDSVLREYIEENLSAKALFAAVAKKPLEGARLVAAILRK
ncbi:MAG: NAD(P)/FAD-dependent oxidoreductase [Thermoproteus sp. AZ2]|uniref:NAD(P)/FAD-dependent oxidoreductase n=1 Tax=Thermoproteus sp. AZ2 TaxID=1609232 RepID=A0ACC6UZB7_9CREN